jgi:hypothetical protein
VSLNEGVIIGLVGIVFLLMWMALLINSIHREISAIRKLLSSTLTLSKTISKESKNSKDIRDSKNDIEYSP